MLADHPPPRERRALVERALDSVDVPRIEETILWVAERLGFVFPTDTSLTVEVYVVASGVPSALSPVPHRRLARVLRVSTRPGGVDLRRGRSSAGTFA